MKKVSAVINAAALFFFLGTFVPAYAMQNQEEHPKAEHQEAPKGHGSQESRKQNGHPQGTHGKSQMQMQQHNRPPAKNTHHANYNNHHSAPAHAQYRGRIPQDRYSAHFGRAHRFRVQHVTIVQGHPRFQYSGYWFQLGTPWPAGWSYDDDCYIDYVNGFYYLYNPIHPGVRIRVVVIQ
jgi:hypothetical protein